MTEERARKFIPNLSSQKRKQTTTHTSHKHKHSSVARLGARSVGLVLFCFGVGAVGCCCAHT